MKVDEPRRNWVTLEEPIVRPGAESAAAGDVMTALCLWQAGSSDVLKMDPQIMRDPSGREWSPRDPNMGDEVDMDAEKAIRVLAATRRVGHSPRTLVSKLPAVLPKERVMLMAISTSNLEPRRPVYLDGSLLVLRSAVLAETIFVWTRMGTPDPPEVALVEPGRQSDDGSDSMLARALAARDTSSKTTGWLRSGNEFGPGGRP